MKIPNVLEKLPVDAVPLDGATAAAKRTIDAKLQLMNESVGILLRILNPIVPRVTHALWKGLGFENQLGEILTAGWPEVDQTP